MSFNRDMDGSIVPLGRVAKRLREDFVPGGAWPTWLEAQAGTASFDLVSSPISASGARISTAAAAGSGARLRTTFDIAPTIYREISFTLYGLRFGNDDGFDIWYQISQTGNDRGVSFMHDNATGDAGAHWRAHSGAGTFTDHATGYNLKKTNGGSRAPRNVTMRFRPQVGEVAMLEDDQVMAYANIAGQFALGGMRPQVTLTARTAVAQTLIFSGAELLLIHN